MRETVQERWIDPDQLLKPSSKSYKDAHVAAVQDIAEQYFGYPTPEYPHLRTFVNEPEVTQKLFTNLGRELAPDILVLEWPEKLPRIVAEVATPDMLTEAMAEQLWAVEANLVDVVFYLYVPAGHASEAKRLLKGAKIKNVKLRTWRGIMGLKTIDVAPLRV